MLRIIAGNPVTMSKMTATVPDAGSYAPVTILVVERPDGRDIVLRPRGQRHRTVRRRGGLRRSPRRLDAPCVTLLRDAAG